MTVTIATIICLFSIVIGIIGVCYLFKNPNFEVTLKDKILASVCLGIYIFVLIIFILTVVLY